MKKSRRDIPIRSGKTAIPDKANTISDGTVKVPEKPPRGMAAPLFRSLLSPADAPENPLSDVEYPGDLQGNVDAEISAVLQNILAERAHKRDEFRLLADSEYWLCICFQSYEQKMEFLRQARWDHLGDKYVNGLEVARLLGLDVQPIFLPSRTGRVRMPKSLRGMEVIGNEGRNE